ncbi:peptidase M24, structural domain-containing protein [Paraphysoderma sedebokerense]|nr:peptidase M24, structural domain-containing protein [Paraphysoderma sedebokerense]
MHILRRCCVLASAKSALGSAAIHSSAVCPSRRKSRPTFTQDPKSFGSYSLITPSPSLFSATKPQTTLRTIPPHISTPDYFKNPHVEPPIDPEIEIKSPDEIEIMRNVGRIAKKVLLLGGEIAKEGITTDQIDTVLHEAILSHGAYPSPLNYKGFPKSICTSVNNVIAHGIPDSRQLENGDIINIDITVYKNQFHADCSSTYLIGDVDPPGQKLVEVTKQALEAAINVCRPGAKFAEIGRAVHRIASANFFAISPSFCGHGIGRQFHTLPLVYHHLNNGSTIMKPGMTFTIEPILCQGTYKHVIWPDGWTVVTKDGGRSAQFEETVAITEEGVKILTRF